MRNPFSKRKKQRRRSPLRSPSFPRTPSRTPSPRVSLASTATPPSPRRSPRSPPSSARSAPRRSPRSPPSSARSARRRASPISDLSSPISLLSDDDGHIITTPPRRPTAGTLRDFKGLMVDVCHSSVHLLPPNPARLASLRRLIAEHGIRVSSRPIDPVLAPSTIVLASAEDLRKLVCLLPPLNFAGRR